MIYVLGSLNMDMVAVVPYMPAAGETLTAVRYYENPGGKGANQAVAIAKLGGGVRMIGKVGTDAFGRELTANLRTCGVDTAQVKEADVKSGVALILVENGENRIVLSPGANYVWERGDVDEGLRAAQRGDILIMQLEVPLWVIEYAAKTAREKGMRVILNPAPAVSLPDSLYSCLDVIAPNETETQLLTGISPTAESLGACAEWFTAKGVGSVIITLGSRGSAVLQEGKLNVIPARKVTVVDTTSAGDTFVGACAVMLEQGARLSDAARFATVASSITITRAGAAASIPTLCEVEAALEETKC